MSLPSAPQPVEPPSTAPEPVAPALVRAYEGRKASDRSGPALRPQEVAGGVWRGLAALPFPIAASLLFWVSSLSRPWVPAAMQFRFSDKLMHACAYSLVGGAALLFAWAWRGALVVDNRRALAGSAALLGVVYGCFDEVHQAFVPGRSASWGDVAADALGSGAGAIVGVLVLERGLAWLRRRRSPTARS